MSWPLISQQKPPKQLDKDIQYISVLHSNMFSILVYYMYISNITEHAITILCC